MNATEKNWGLLPGWVAEKMFHVLQPQSIIQTQIFREYLINLQGALWFPDQWLGIIFIVGRFGDLTGLMLQQWL